MTGGELTIIKGRDGWSYVKTDIPKLKENQIYVSYVGDGEYDFNTFGHAFTNLSRYLEILKEREKLQDVLVGLIYSEWSDINKNNFYILKSYKDSFYYEIARITIEDLDREDFPIGEK